jgi:hypothetical protein
MKSQSYMTRALRARDPRFATILGKLGYGRRDLIAADPLDHDGDGRRGGSPKHDAGDDLTAARAAYQEAVGKRPFHGWSIDELNAKIAEAKG